MIPTLILLWILMAIPLLKLAGVGQGIANAIKAPCRRIVFGGFAIAAISGLLIAISQILSLLTRNIFGLNFIWLQESALYGFGMMFLLSGGAVFLMDAHVRVDIFYTNWSDRRKALLDLLGLYLFIFPVCLLIIIASGPYVEASWSNLEGSPEPTGIPAVFLLKTLIPAFAVLLALAGVVRAIELVDTLRPSLKLKGS